MSETVARTATRCPECGADLQRETCQECNGSGRVCGLGLGDTETPERKWEDQCFECGGAGTVPVCACGWGREGRSVEPMVSYQAFLDAKRLVIPPTGIDVPLEDLHPWLFMFQKRICQWSLKRGRSAVFAGTGTGKTGIQCEFAKHTCKHTGGDVLIFAPLAVTHQTVREAQKIDLTVTLCRTQADVRPGVNIANYEMLDHFDARSFSGLVIDECFAAGTLIDTPSGEVPIEQIRVGDRILNASGVDRVSDVHRREVPYAIRISVGLDRIISSPNHPYFTQRGWVSAQDLLPGDYLTQTSEAMRLVRSDFHAEVHRAEASAFLREILLCEMADAATGDSSEVSVRIPLGGRGGVLTVSPEDADLQSVSWHPHGEQGYVSGWFDGKDQLAHRVVGARAFGEQAEFDHINREKADCRRENLRPATRSQNMQNTGPRRDSRSGIKGVWFDRGRNKWQAQCQKDGKVSSRRFVAREDAIEWVRARQGEDVAYQRVTNVEVLESGHPELERLRDADGKLYFYDLGATRHPSYSVAACLVHNSSILKSYEGTTRKALTDFASHIPFRLACTATPAPNDLIELVNHSEFLGVLTGKEVAAVFFTQDEGTTHKWRLKGHARQDFWRWLASWSVAIRRPSDIGYPDDKFILPPLNIHQVTVECDAAPPGRLFVVEAQTLDEVRGAMRASLPARVAACAELVNQSTEPWLVWCNLNNESSALARAIPDAVEVRGSDTTAHKEKALLDFIEGRVRVIVSKSSICGYGLNLQHCAHVAFVGLSFSWEQYYQSIRRCWRFGQTRPVECYVITSEAEGRVVEAIRRKEEQAEEMLREIVSHMQGLQLEMSTRSSDAYLPTQTMKVPRWLKTIRSQGEELVNGACAH